MKRIYLFISIICGAFISIALMGHIPVESKYQSKKNVKFKLIQTFGAEEKPKGALLSGVFDITTDKWNNLYVSASKAIHSFKADGTLRWVLDKEGAGPGDIKNPRGIAVDGEKYLYVANVSIGRIDRFNLDGKYINTLKMPASNLPFLHLAGFIKPDLLVINHNPLSRIAEDIYIMKIGNMLELKNHFVVDETGDVKLLSNQAVGLGVKVLDDKIAIGNCYNYKSTIYDISGKLIKTLKKDFRRLPKPYVYSNGFGVYGGVLAPVKVKGKYYVSYAMWPSDTEGLEKQIAGRRNIEYESSIDIFDENSNLIYSETFNKKHPNEIGQPIYSDSNGYLYTSKNMPYPQICKYEVIISDKK